MMWLISGYREASAIEEIVSSFKICIWEHQQEQSCVDFIRTELD